MASDLAFTILKLQMIRKVLIDITCTDYSMIRTKLPGHFETRQYFLACPKLKKKIVLINLRSVHSVNAFITQKFFIDLNDRPKVIIFLVYLKNRYYTLIS